MATITEYETIFIANPNIDPTKLAGINEKVKSITSASGATLLTFRDWGVRKLAYHINKERRGHYFQLSFVAGRGTVTELERNLRLDENIFRFITVRMGEVTDIAKRKEELEAQSWKSPIDHEAASAEHADAQRGRRSGRFDRSRQNEVQDIEETPEGFSEEI